MIFQLLKTRGLNDTLLELYGLNTTSQVASRLKGETERTAVGVFSEIYYGLIHNKKLYDFGKAWRLDIAPDEPDAIWKRFVTERIRGDNAKPVGICTDATHLIVSIAKKMGWKGVHMASSIGIYHEVPLLVSPSGTTYVISDVGAYQVKEGRSAREETAKILGAYSPIQYIDGKAAIMPSWEKFTDRINMKVFGPMFYVPYLSLPGEGASRFIFRADSDADALATIRSGNHTVSAFLVKERDASSALGTALGAAYTFFGGRAAYKKGKVSIESKYSLSGIAGYFSMKKPDLENFTYFNSNNPLQPALALANLGYYLDTKYNLGKNNALELLTGINLMAGVPFQALPRAFVIGAVGGADKSSGYKIFFGLSPYLAPATAQTGEGYGTGMDLIAGAEAKGKISSGISASAFFSTQLDFAEIARETAGVAKGRLELEYNRGQPGTPTVAISYGATGSKYSGMPELEQRLGLKIGLNAGSSRNIYNFAVIVEGKKTGDVYGYNVGAIVRLP